MKSCHAWSVKACPPGSNESMSTLYAATIPIGTMKKTASQATGSPSRPGAVRSGRRSLRRERPAASSCDLASTATGVPGSTSLGGLHLFPELLVLVPPRDVAVEVRLRRPERLRVVDLELLRERARRRMGERVRVAVVVVLLEPLPRLDRAPRIHVGMCELRTRCVLHQHEVPDPGNGLLPRRHVRHRKPLRLHRCVVGGPGVRDPDVARRERLLHVRLGRPDEPHELLLRDEEVLRPLQLCVGLVPGVLEPEEKPCDLWHLDVVEPGDLPLVA